MKKYAVLTREPRCFLGSFDFSWEQRKLSELTSMHARIGWQNLRTSEFLDSGNYMLITGTDFNDGAINFSTCHYVERERYEQDRNIQIHNGSILITKDGTLGKVAYVQGLSMPATLNAGVFNVQIKDANNVDEKYLFQYLKAPFLMDYVDKKATGGTIKHLNQSILVDFPVILPQRSEQTLIGAFFQQLDNLITLHQRKCALLFSPFQALISMMFTTSTFSWEQRKVGDLLIERNQQAPMSDEYPLMAFIANEGVAPKGERYDRSALVTDTVNKLYKKTEKGDFIYSSNNLETGSIGLNKYGKACISPVYSIFEPTGIADSDFLGRRLVRKDFINAMVKWRQGVIYGQWRIHESDFLKIEIPVPSVEEQRKIGAYPVFYVMANTGMRVGEITGLRWSDIDLKKGIIRVNHTLVYYNHRDEKGCYFSINTPKTKAGEREIPMTEGVKQAFLMEREFQSQAEISSKSRVDGYDDFIFVNRYGDVQNQGNLNKALRRMMRDCNDEILEKYGADSDPVLLPQFSCHILRHTFATRLCESGANLKFIQSILGHADVSTTMNIYVDVTDALKKKEITAFDDYMTTKLET